MSALRGSLRLNVAISWLVHGAGLVIGFFLMPYVIRVLGDSQYGAWVFINSIAGYAGLLYLGFGATISRYVAKYQATEDWQKLNEVASLVQAVYLCMGLIALSVAGTIAWLAPSFHHWAGVSLLEFRLVILVLGLNVATGLAGSVYGGVLIGLRRFDLERSISFTIDASRAILIVVFLSREWGLLTIALVYWVITLIENLGFWYWSTRLLPQLSLRTRHLNWNMLKECSGFSGFAFLNAIAQQLIYATDTVVIGCLFGGAAIVPYFIALRLCTLFRQPLDKINDICIPTAGALEAQASTGKLQHLLQRALCLSIILSTGLLIGLFFFGDDLIHTWMGTGYEATPHLLLILMLGQIVALPVGVIRGILFGTGYVRLPALIYLAEALANLGVSLALARWWGLAGVAWGTTIPILVFELGIILPVGLQILQFSGRRLWNEVLLPQIIPLCLLWLYSYSITRFCPAPGNWPALIGIALGGGVVLLAGVRLQQVLHKVGTQRTVTI